MRPTCTRLALALAAALALAGCDGAPADAGADATAAGTAADELVVDLKDGSSLDVLRQRYGLSGARWNSANVEDEAIAVVNVPRAEHDALLARLRQDPDVEAAEPSFVVSLDPSETLNAPQGGDTIPEEENPRPTDAFPNDPLYGKQWNMEMVHARDAWRFATGEDVIVAVIDTGVGYEGTKRLPAPDLQLTDFVPGYDFVNDDKDAGDDHGHGTHCAGTIAQSTNNGRGVIGLAHRARIMPLKVLSAGGWGTTVDIADAIRFAADHGAHVLSLSLGGGGHSKVLADAVKYARDKGCMVVCAAGNGGRPRVEYPAAYPGATAVSSVGPKGTLAFYSSHGKQTFIAAPGGDKSYGAESGVLQNTVDPRGRRTVYAYWQGTSMATPHVAGASALLYQCGVTDPDAVEAILKSTADVPGDLSESGWTQKYGWGVLDAGGAVRHALFVPGWVSLVVAAVLLLLGSRKLAASDVSLPLSALGALAAACGLFFLRPFGLGEVPVVGGFLTRGMADWDIPLFGASWHWTPLFASALIPGFLGFVSLKSRVLRSVGFGLMLGWAARLVTGVLLPWADVRLIPGHGLLDMAWLALNAVVLVAWAAVVIRLGRGKVVL